jgi:hypothetical protein
MLVWGEKKIIVLQALRKKEDNGNKLCGPIIPTIKGRRCAK